MVTGKNAIWAIDENVQDAIFRCKRGGGKSPFIVCLIPKGSEIDGLTISYPENAGFIVTQIGKI